MSGDRGISQDELLSWIEDDLSPEVAADVERRLGLDPELAEWARGARADRHGVRALAAAEGSAAPSGLWRDALAEAERRALLAEEIEPVRGPFVLRVTPGRLVAAAAVLLIASVGTIAPVLLNKTNRPAATEGPVLAEAPALRSLERAERAGEGFVHQIEDAVQGAAPRAALVSESHGWAADPNGIVAGRAFAGFGAHSMSALQPRVKELPRVLPDEWGMTIAEAQRLAASGQLVVDITAGDPDRYAQRLLAAVGERGEMLSPGQAPDVNGLSAPVELVLTVPIERVERSLRLSAIAADGVTLQADPSARRAGAWASDAMWWAGRDRHEGTVRVRVSR